MNFIKILGLISAVLMPFWNIPLIVRIIKRKTSNDISLWWVTGIWVCVMAMLPSSLVSKDLVLKSFGIVNAVLFSIVFFTVIKFHNRSS